MVDWFEVGERPIVTFIKSHNDLATIARAIEVGKPQSINDLKAGAKLPNQFEQELIVRVLRKQKLN